MPDLIERCQNWFNNHARKHVDLAPEHVLPLVKQKIGHTMRVLGHVRQIIEDSDIPPGIAQLAEISAILHDVARFPQLVNKATYDDRQGFNHAEEGARLLRETDLLSPLPKVEQEIVLTTVGLHNRGTLPDDLDPDTRLTLHILRDADKLDIICSNLKYMSPDSAFGKALKVGLTWHDTEVSPEAVGHARAGELIPFEAITWSNDFILSICCWLYDLHFPYIYRQLAGGPLQGFLDLLPDGAPFDAVKVRIQTDLKRLAATA